MAREDDFLAVIQADTALMALASGGAYSSGAVGLEGITRERTPTAFDDDDYLLPSILVRQRDLITDGVVDDPIEQVISARQVVEIYTYQDRGYGVIDQMLTRLYQLFQGHQFNDGFPAQWVQTIERLTDEGSLGGASVARQDWAIYTIFGG